MDEAEFMTSEMIYNVYLSHNRMVVFRLTVSDYQFGTTNLFFFNPRHTHQTNKNAISILTGLWPPRDPPSKLFLDTYNTITGSYI